MQSSKSLSADRFKNFLIDDNDSNSILAKSPSPLIQSLSGAVGALLAAFAVYPLDNVRTRLQMSRRQGIRGLLVVIEEVVRREGTLGLYSGLSSALVCVGAAWGVYFYFYHYIKSRFSRFRNHSFTNLMSAIASGIISAVLTNPIWVVNTREKLGQNEGKSPGLLAALVKLAKTEGIKGLMAGIGPSLVLVANPALQFVVYEKLKSVIVNLKHAYAAKMGRRQYAQWLSSTPRLSSTEFFLIGALAKLASTVATYPHQVAKTRLQSKQTSPEETYNGTIDCLAKIVAYEGPQGLYRGMLSKLLATMLTSAIMFTTYEKCLVAVQFLETICRSLIRRT
eukprot:GHVL01015123.1.p1 GENE.GHVL01015123.1~~GHVL01015123.1.p1  ORF type:complete len:360 (-),score=56.48 GHVL01015123.1:1473-2483(-)